MAASFSLRPQDSLWVGAHDARLTGDVVDETPGCEVDRADWSGASDDLGDGVCPHHKLSLPYRALSSCPFAQVFEDDATRFRTPQNSRRQVQTLEFGPGAKHVVDDRWATFQRLNHRRLPELRKNPARFVFAWNWQVGFAQDGQ